MAELKFDGLHVDQYKARQVALDNKKEYRLDYDETFALVVKMTLFGLLLQLQLLSCGNNPFLHGDRS